MTAYTEPLIERLRRATIGRYDIYAELGSGGMASVFLALDLSLNRKVAIKVLAPHLASAPDNVTRFRREAMVAAALDHPNIIGILAVGDDPDLAYFVMKYVEGSTLDGVIADEGAQSIPFARSILATTARALHYAHQRGVIHRDVKPANLMLDLEGRLIITDFGIAKMEDAHGLTVTGSVIGTPYYMSPEQFNGLPVTGATDQYALGVVAYELLTGLQPYRGRTVGEVMRGHLFDPIPSVRSEQPNVPEDLDAAVTRMLAKRAEDRFPTLEDAVRAIEVGGDESLVRTQIIELARSGARQRPVIRVPVSPSPAVRARAPGGPAGKTVVTGEPRRRVAAAWVTLAILLGAVGATAALRPDLLGIAATNEIVSDSSRLAPRVLTEGAPIAAPPATIDSSSTPQRDAPRERRATKSGASTPSAPATQPAAAPTEPFGPPAAAPEQTTSRPNPVPAAVDSGMVSIGNGVLYGIRVNNGPLIPSRGVKRWTLPAGPQRIEIRARGCEPWDSTVTVIAGQVIRIGTRPVSC